MAIPARKLALLVVMTFGIASLNLSGQVQAVNGSIQGEVADSNGASANTFIRVTQFLRVTNLLNVKGVVL